MEMTTEWGIETCCNCGMQFAVPKDVQTRWKEHGQRFYCPNGHGQHYSKSRVATEREARLEAEERLRQKELRVEELEGRILELMGTPVVKRKRGRPRKFKTD